MHSRTPKLVALLVVLIIVAFVVRPESVAQKAPEKPVGFQQILPRGGIPAIVEPEYVTVEKATIADDAYVLGIVIDGQPLAYSLNLLNRHEIVNDTVGKTNFAAVW